MKFLLSLPLTILPLIAYNVLVFANGEAPIGDTWDNILFEFGMVSGAQFAMVTGDVMITAALFLLFIEMLKATRTGVIALADHIFSMLVFVVYLVEFLAVRQAATSVFFILMAIALIDVIAGFSITISGARRDVSFAHGEGRH